MNECLCFARDAREFEPERFAWCGNVLWAYWPECPVHQERFTSPVWTARMGRLENTTASAYQAEAVESEA